MGNRPSDLREAGFRAALTARGGDPDLIVRHEYSIEGGVAAATQLLARDVSAIVAASDEMALGTVKAGRRAGLAVPDDLSVVGYDDAFPLEFMDPPLTTVRQPIERLAQALVPVVTRLVQGVRPWPASCSSIPSSSSEVRRRLAEASMTHL